MSHDLKGYDGISDVVFRVLTSVMEAHHSSIKGGDEGTGGIGGQLVVNKAPEKGVGGGERPKEDREDERDLNAVEGFEEGRRLAEVSSFDILSFDESLHEN